ncbi:MAG: MFS transporter [Acidobacteria bacterium]|nr:MFS transporter [Acidobacteriota bacterium]
MTRLDIRPENLKATAWGTAATAVLGVLIVAGSRRLNHFDAALVGYTFAVLFATFGVTYRYAMWLMRPTTAIYWRRGWQVFLRPKYIGRNIALWIRHVGSDFVLNAFVFRRGKARWMAHWLIMWGCVLATAITFPLVFGWVHFATVTGDFGTYEAFVFGFPVSRFQIDSLIGFLTFHGLVWASILVTLGVMLAMRRRMRDRSAAAIQQFGEDFLPLILLFAISVTGLMLTASYTWMKGYAYDFLAILHAITVIFTLLWLPFGKFFHIFQRPAQIGVAFYKEVGRLEPPAHCRRCGHGFTSELHVRDLIEAERVLGYRYDIDGEVEHYQWICPPCRRSMLVLAQGRAWADELGTGVYPLGGESPDGVTPRFGNAGVNQGPLGSEDRDNFHP